MIQSLRAAVAALAFLGTACLAQVVAPAPPAALQHRPPPPTAWTPVSTPRWVLPQMGRAAGQPAIQVTQVHAGVVIEGSVATTTLNMTVQNHSMQAQEAVLLVPVPGAATVTGFTFQGPAAESTATFMPRDDARRLYDSIVQRERDPALLEWAGWNLLRSSVFPVAAHGMQQMQIVWEELLTGAPGRLDYVLPRSDVRGGLAWTLEVVVKGADVASVYSPSHEIMTARKPNGVYTRANLALPGAFRLSVMRSSAPAASVLTYPDPTAGGGYFLMMVGAPPPNAQHAQLRREVTLVLDRSGSMAGAPFERTKAAALQILGGLGAHESANVIDFSNGVSRFAPAPVVLTPEKRSEITNYVAALRPSGGTNIHDALLEALRQPAPGPDTLGVVLFVTDGVPTVGRTREPDIRVLAEQGNAAGRRVFTIGLGNDINVPLLDRISDCTHALSTYIELNDNNLAAKLNEVSERLRGPVVTNAQLTVLDSAGQPAPGRVEEILPLRLPDIFRDGTLVVLGRYRGDKPFQLSLTGTMAGAPTSIPVTVNPQDATTGNSFVPRLWASRRIAVLIDEIRQQGLDPATGGVANPNDPRWRELAGEIVRLSTTFGILTEYTSMLALEGSSFHDMRALEIGCLNALNGRAVSSRVGAAAANQGRNWNRQKLEAAQSSTNMYIAANGQQVETANLNQCGDKTFYKVGTAWADASLAGSNTAVDEEVAYGSERYWTILWELVDESRQSALAQEGDVMLHHRGKTILIRNVTVTPNNC